MERLSTTLCKSLIGIAILLLLLSAAVYFYGSFTDKYRCGIFLCFFIPACIIILMMVIGVFIMSHTMTTDYKKEITDLKQEITKLKETHPTDKEIKYREKLLVHEEKMAEIKYRHSGSEK